MHPQQLAQLRVVSKYGGRQPYCECLSPGLGWEDQELPQFLLPSHSTAFLGGLKAKT